MSSNRVEYSTIHIQLHDADPDRKREFEIATDMFRRVRRWLPFDCPSFFPYSSLSWPFTWLQQISVSNWRTSI